MSTAAGTGRGDDNMSAAVEAELTLSIETAGERTREPRFVPVDELGRLAGGMAVEYRPLVSVAGMRGLRWSECAGIRVGALGFLRRTLAVRETMAEVERAESFRT